VHQPYATFHQHLYLKANRLPLDDEQQNLRQLRMKHEVQCLLDGQYHTLFIYGTNYIILTTCIPMTWYKPRVAMHSGNGEIKKITETVSTILLFCILISIIIIVIA
jgi:hypothetical protein